MVHNINSIYILHIKENEHQWEKWHHMHFNQQVAGPDSFSKYAHSILYIHRIWLAMFNRKIINTTEAKACKVLDNLVLSFMHFEEDWTPYRTEMNLHSWGT